MAIRKSRSIYNFFIQLILLHSVKSQADTGIYFKLIKGTIKESNGGSTTLLIDKEFFQCGREKPCTHVMQVASEYMTIHGNEELRKRKNSAMRIYEKVKAEGIVF